MNVRQALYIRTIAEEKGVTAAAKKLHISQPSLSQMLRQIEEEAGTPLFERGTQVFHPTYAGERYLHAEEVILNTNEILENELREIRGEERGRLRLGISVQRSIQLLPKVLPEFTRLYPKVEFRLHEAGSAYLEQMVQSGQVDLALASVEPASPRLEYRLLHRERIGILTGPGSPLARRFPSGAAIPLSEAMDAPFVTLRSGHSARIVQERLFREQGLRPVVFLETDIMEAARQVAVRCGYYMVCADSYLPDGVCFYPLKGYENHRHFYACLRKGEPVAHYVDALIRMVGEV